MRKSLFNLAVGGLLALIATAAVGAESRHVRRKLMFGINVQGEAGINGHRIVLASEPVDVEISVDYNSVSSNARGAPLVLGSSNEWWRVMPWAIEDASGTHRIALNRLRIVSSEHVPASIAIRHPFSFVISIGALPPGAYALTVHPDTSKWHDDNLDVVLSTRSEFVVRKGDEDTEAKIAYLRRQPVRTRVEQEGVFRQLIALQPEESDYFMQLGDLLLLDGSVDEAARLFRREGELRRFQIAVRWDREPSGAATVRARQRLATIEGVQRLIAAYKLRPSALRFAVGIDEPRKVKAYALIERATGKRVQTVDDGTVVVD